MEKKRTLLLNLGVIGVVLALAVAALLLSRVLPPPQITPATASPEEAGVSITFDPHAD